jgi:hypothetical protein
MSNQRGNQRSNQRGNQMANQRGNQRDNQRSNIILLKVTCSRHDIADKLIIWR